MRLSYRLIFLLLAAVSCTGLKLPEAESCIVLEGWIEDGRYPIVLLTTSVPVSQQKQDIESLDDHVVRWGKVTISDGEREVVLTGGPDDRFIPPYSYTTARMRGEAGKTYTVKAKYKGMEATAVTTVPEKKELEYLRVEQIEGSEDCRIVAGLKDNKSTKDFYKFFVMREGKDSSFMSSFLGLVNDEVLTDETNEISIYNSMTVRDSLLHQYFTCNDIVHVRFATLDETSWIYWNDFEEIQSLSRNPFFPVSNSIRSNVKGGLGYWTGYGSSYYKVSIPDTLSVMSAQ